MSLAQRGYTLIAVMIILVALTVVGTAAVKMSGSELRSASAYQRESMLASCAQAARATLIGQLRFMDPIPASFSMEVLGPQPSGGVGAVLQIQEGHVREPDGADIASIEFITEAELGSGREPALHPQITNDILPPGGASGSAARIVARCEDRAGRMQEIEFLVRFGI